MERRVLFPIDAQPDERAWANGRTVKGNSYPIVGIKARITSNQRSPCSPHCKCVCHDLRYISTPRSLRNFLGAFFVGYTGYPHTVLRRCNIAACKGQRRFNSSVVYCFPLWFLRNIVSFNLMTNSLKQVHISLKTMRVMCRESEQFRLVISNDVKGLQRLFRLGRASLNDVGIDNGVTALHVSISGYDSHL